MPNALNSSRDKRQLGRHRGGRRPGHRRGAGRAGDGLLPRRARSLVCDRGRQPRGRPHVALALAVTEAVHRGPVQRPAGDALSRPSGTPTRARTRSPTSFGTTSARFELPVRLNTTVTRLSRADDGGYRGRDDHRADRGRPGRRRYRSVPGPVHAARSPTSSTRARPSSTAPTTRAPRPARGTDPCRRRGQLGPADRARACPTPARSTSRSVRSCRRCRSGRSGATSGGG